MGREATKHAEPASGASDAKNDAAPLSSQAFERHYTPAELAALWSLSEDAVRRLFEKEPGVLVLTQPKPGKRSYRTLRIPESVARRVHKKLCLLYTSI